MLRFDVVSRLPSRLTQADLGITAQHLTRALRLKRPSIVHLTFLTESSIQKVNKKTRQHDRPTDVLSFASAEEVRRLTPKGAEVDLGEIIICPQYATREAKRRSIDPREELIRLLVHGVLHIEGYDHAAEKEEARMFALQEQLVAKVIASN